jgi:hydroxymethylpyrimidine pyrophosphatase-like HAD family hydrolase
MKTNTGKINKETIFVDLDGTLILFNLEPERYTDRIIMDTMRFLIKKKSEGHCIVCTTARTYEHTMLAIKNAGIPLDFFDRLVCDLPMGRRILINDRKANGLDSAIAINLYRDQGDPDGLLQDIPTCETRGMTNEPVTVS